MGSSARHSGPIAVDAMGGDHGPGEVVAALKLAFADLADLNPVTLVGDEAVLGPLVAAARLVGHPLLKVMHASQTIAMADKPMAALKAKKDSSMVRAIELVKNGDAAALVSCGNTGALMAGGTLRLRMLEGVERPALAAVIPREHGHFILIDAGANPETTAEQLVHNAILGANYARVVFPHFAHPHVAPPRVGLLTIGTEEGKGNALTAEAHGLLKEAGSLFDYVGPTEGFQIFKNHCDVAVCDGFVGNLLLKSWESLAHFFSATLKKELRANPLRASGAFLSRGAFHALKLRINPERYSGAPLLGLRGNIIKAHGSSNRHAIKSAIRAANQVVKADMLHRCAVDIARARALHPRLEPAHAG